MFALRLTSWRETLNLPEKHLLLHKVKKKKKEKDIEGKLVNWISSKSKLSSYQKDYK